MGMLDSSGGGFEKIFNTKKYLSIAFCTVLTNNSVPGYVFGNEMRLSMDRGEKGSVKYVLTFQNGSQEGEIPLSLPKSLW